ncbi:hypothetical protein [Lichenicoccus sp.]|uniref:hypothetical protein n=1 Tax=Lichenicoccus sp. TaxID=2781899 RepID=UPI003D118C95
MPCIQRPCARLRFLAAGLLVASLPALSLLGGCKLVDQRTFDRNAGRKPVAHAPAVAKAGPPPVPPLLVVPTRQAPDDWQPRLSAAVHEALARKPNVLFTVQSIARAEPGADAQAQATALRAVIDSEGRAVAQAITADGASALQVEMSAFADPAAKDAEVRVFVR